MENAEPDQHIVNYHQEFTAVMNISNVNSSSHGVVNLVILSSTPYITILQAM